MVQPFVKEIPRNQNISGAEIEWREHSRVAEAKAVITGATPFPQDKTTPSRNEAPTIVTVGAASTGVALDLNTFYELISTTDLHLTLSNDSATAVAALTSDYFLPAGKTIVINTAERWRRIDAIQNSAGGSLFIQRVLM